MTPRLVVEAVPLQLLAVIISIYPSVTFVTLRSLVERLIVPGPTVVAV